MESKIQEVLEGSCEKTYIVQDLDTINIGIRDKLAKSLVVIKQKLVNQGTDNLYEFLDLEDIYEQYAEECEGELVEDLGFDPMDKIVNELPVVFSNIRTAAATAEAEINCGPGHTLNQLQLNIRHN